MLVGMRRRAGLIPLIPIMLCSTTSLNGSAPPTPPTRSSGVNSGLLPLDRIRPGNIMTISWSPELAGSAGLKASAPPLPLPTKTNSG